MTTTQLSIIDAIQDRNLFRPFLGSDLSTWRAWFAALRVLHGLPNKSTFAHELVKTCTGRDPHEMPADGFTTALFLIGRRSGKSRMAALCGAYAAVLEGLERKLAKGERGLVPIVSPTKQQGRIIRNYLRAIFETPLLAAEVVDEQKEGFSLRNGNRIEILAGDFRTVRGYTLLSVIVDEIAFFGLDEESKVKSDTELIRALKPALATTGGRLIAIGSPYARKGWSYQTFKRNFGNDAASILVWNAASRTMNPTLAQEVIDQAMQEDMAAAKSEYLGEFRDDVGIFLPREVIERLVVKERLELLPQSDRRYLAFVDVSGGRGDDAALAIAHRDERKVVLDFVKAWKPPFDPHEVIASMAEELRRFGIRRVTGDNYSAEFVASAFESCGIRYQKSELAKSGLYLELLPRLCSSEIALLDNEALINQLAALERRTRSGGKDVVDHPAGSHDDLANAVAGVAWIAATKRVAAGAAGF